MASDLVTLADSVTTALNALLDELGYTVTATRSNKPRWKLAELSTLKVTVSPVSRPSRIDGKGGTLVATQPRVDIEFKKHTGDDQDAEDDLIELAEVIAERFLEGVDGLTGVMEADSSAVYPTEEMIAAGVFAAAISLTFSVGRAPR